MSKKKKLAVDSKLPQQDIKETGVLNVDFDAMVKWMEQERDKSSAAKARRTFNSDAVLRSYNL